MLYGAFIENINPNLAPNSDRLGDDVLAGNRILPGIDNVLQSVVAVGDQELGGFISPGPDRQCNTPAPVPNTVSVVGSFKQCEIAAKSDWDNLHVQSVESPRIANTAFGSLGGDNWEPTLEEILEERKRNAVTDLGIVSSSEFDSGTGTIEIEYTLTNNGFMPATFIGVNVDLPSGVEFAGCSGDAAFNCVPYDGVVSASIDELSPLSSVTLLVRLAVACPNAGEEFAVVAQVVSLSRDPDLTNNQVAINVEHPDVLRVGDALHPWVVQNSGGQTVPVEPSQGALDLGCGNLQFESPTFDTFELGRVGTALAVDVFVPSGSWPGWVGDLQLNVDVPSGGVWNASAGYHNLGGVPQGAWTTLTYPLTAEVQAALLEDLPDARLRFSSNVATCDHQVLFRNVRFSGELTCQAPSDPVVPRVSSSVLTFDALGDWVAEAAELSASSLATQGSGSIAIDPSGWGRMVSREFSTTELASVTSTMAFDVHIPDLPPDYYWLGGLNLFVDCPNVGLWNRWVGYQALQILFDDQFNTIQFALPQDVTGVLTNPVAQCRVALEFSSNPQFAGFIVDNGGFVQ